MATENEDWLTFWCVLSGFDLITGFLGGGDCLFIINSKIILFKGSKNKNGLFRSRSAVLKNDFAAFRRSYGIVALSGNVR